MIKTEQELTVVCVAVVAMNSSAVSQFVILLLTNPREGRVLPSWGEHVGTRG